MNRKIRRMGWALAALLWLSLPSPAIGEDWTVDPTHTMVNFKSRYVMISWVRGRFPTVKGEVFYVPGKPETAKAQILIDAASIDTQHERRDTHLKSPDFLEVEKHPTITFTSKRVQNVRKEGFELVGDLTIRGVTKEVVLKVEDLSQVTKDHRGRPRVAASGAATINRHDFGVSWNRLLDAGGVMVGDEVHINIDLQLVKKGAAG